MLSVNIYLLLMSLVWLREGRIEGNLGKHVEIGMIERHGAHYSYFP